MKADQALLRIQEEAKNIFDEMQTWVVVMDGNVCKNYWRENSRKFHNMWEKFTNLLLNDAVFSIDSFKESGKIGYTYNQ